MKWAHFYLQQTQGIGLSIHLNKLLHYSNGYTELCKVAGVLKAHAMTKHDAWADCRAKDQSILLWLVQMMISVDNCFQSIPY